MLIVSYQINISPFFMFEMRESNTNNMKLIYISKNGYVQKEEEAKKKKKKKLDMQKPTKKGEHAHLLQIAKIQTNTWLVNTCL